MSHGRKIWGLFIGIGAYQLQLQLCAKSSGQEAEKSNDNGCIKETFGVERCSHCRFENQEKAEEIARLEQENKNLANQIKRITKSVLDFFDKFPSPVAISPTKESFIITECDNNCTKHDHQSGMFGCFCTRCGESDLGSLTEH